MRAVEPVIQWLLPVFFAREQTQADLALVVERLEFGYRAITLLTPEMAYKNARVIRTPPRPWLAAYSEDGARVPGAGLAQEVETLRATVASLQAQLEAMQRCQQPRAQQDEEQLLEAIRSGQGSVVEQFVERTTVAHSPAGPFALGLASAEGRVDMVEALLRAKADVNGGDAAGQTALWRAATAGHTAVARVLIAAKADVNGSNADGLSLISWACEQEQPEMVKLLVDAKADVSNMGSLLSDAAGKGRVGVMEALLAVRAAVNHQDAERGHTPLMRAAGVGSMAGVRLLMEAGADVTSKDSQGKTAVDWAMDKRHVEVLRLLLVVVR
jgi:hypothetical protein